MRQILNLPEYNFIDRKDKDFIIAFNDAIRELRYESGDNISSGYCWGRYMIIYAKTGVKSKQVAARIYIRDSEIILRLFFSKIDKHRAYLENAPEYIKLPFSDEHGTCRHCKNEHAGVCKFRKTYTLANRLMEKCNGVVFEFRKPDLTKLPGYMSLLREFYLSGKM